MNLNHLINMVVNQVVRRVVNSAVDRGINFAWRKKPVSELPPEKHVTTPAELAKDASLRSMADQAAKTAKATRRLGRF
jgi:hypothetical protein